MTVRDSTARRSQGSNSIEESDMVAIPDPESFQLMPWGSGGKKVGRMIADIITPDGEPYEGDPRHVLRKALMRMEDMGFDTFNVGPELEYFYFADDKGTEVLDRGGYFDMTTLDVADEWRLETIRALESMGIPVEYAHHEVGPSQQEIDMRYAPALAMADYTLTYRMIVKEIAQQKRRLRNLHAQSRSSARTALVCTCTCRCSRKGRNAFYSAEDEWHLSDSGKQFIAGQLTHARRDHGVCSRSGSTPTSGSCRATRRRSTSRGLGATARR